MRTNRNNENPGARRSAAGASHSKVSNHGVLIESGGLLQVA
jgi:hypothetical protein